MPCGIKCCCILGGCGCGPDGQVAALAGMISDVTGLSGDAACFAAIKIFEIFGYGPHKQRMHELSVADSDINAEQSA